MKDVLKDALAYLERCTHAIRLPVSVVQGNVRKSASYCAMCGALTIEHGDAHAPDDPDPPALSHACVCGHDEGDHMADAPHACGQLDAIELDAIELDRARLVTRACACTSFLEADDPAVVSLDDYRKARRDR